jgi:myo-inositol-1-phosphate synthase
MRGYPVQTKINVAIAGVGNRASALVQGVDRDRRGAALDGVSRLSDAGYPNR